MRTLRVSLLLLATGSILPGYPKSAATECDPSTYYGDPIHKTTGATPLFTVARDFNEDGRIDLAVTNSNFQVSSGAGTVRGPTRRAGRPCALNANDPAAPGRGVVAPPDSEAKSTAANQRYVAFTLPHEVPSVGVMHSVTCSSAPIMTPEMAQPASTS